jgi:hypothetical protein
VDPAGLALGLIAIGAGSLLAIVGVRFFWVLLALWGAMIGFLAGADIVAAILGDGFLATVAGWIAGIAGAVVLGTLSISLYWAAIVFLCGGVGYALAGAVLLALGVEPGILSIAVGLAAGAGLAILAVVLRAPVLLVALLTSFGGAGYAIAGALLIMGRLATTDLQAGALGALRDRPLAIVAWIALGSVACAYQLLTAREDELRLLGSLDQGRDQAPDAERPA